MIVSLHAALLWECERLHRAERYHPRVGIAYWPEVTPDLTEPEGPGECGICTNGARLIARAFGGYVAGYPIESNYPQRERLIAADCYGHDFAIVDDYLVDWWAWQYEQSLSVPVLHRIRDAALISTKYKPEPAWVIHPANDFRNHENPAPRLPAL